MTGSLQLTLAAATRDDVPSIVRLVNSAYRGESSRVGWTTEADLLGGQRTDAQEVLELIEGADSMILLALQGNEIVGCVHLQRSGDAEAYLGMLTIKPTSQGIGLGKRFLQAAEEVVQDKWGSRRMLMAVISIRDELISYYERRGYHRTGELRPFPTSPRYGVPRVSGLQFAVLEKELSTT